MPLDISSWEMRLFFLINNQWRCTFFDYLMPVVSSPLFLWVVALASTIAIIVTRKARWTIIITLGLAIGVSDLTCYLMKNSVGRVRPYHSVTGTWYVDAGEWIQRPENAPKKKHGSSFPSAHASNAMAATLLIFIALKYKSLWFFPLIIGYSRVYLGKHFPVDILGGWLTGLGVACMLISLYPILLSRVRSLWIKYRLRM